ncbi:MAG: hypothetical protein WAW17_06685 [Rhodococcus sp. (in: high G+C Gram-positive bacteria)]|uniref:hypothetical protein n=1 Tax=Rhodococcus sp. TaxID=1831 RepID=UPI003BB0A96D
MDIAEWWNLLSPESREWLMAHNGEPLEPSIKSEILAAAKSGAQSSWWSGESTDGQSELTDEAIDWIEAFANREDSANG